MVSAFVVDRSFPARFGAPATHDVALAELADALRRVHALPIPSGAVPRDARELLARFWPQLASFAVLAFARAAVERALAEAPPPPERAIVLCHNDVNLTNLVWDGERVLLLDWDTSAPNDPLDLAAIAVFLCLDDATCARLVAWYDGAHAAPLSPRFLYNRRLMPALIGTVFLQAWPAPAVTRAPPTTSPSRCPRSTKRCARAAQPRRRIRAMEPRNGHVDDEQRLLSTASRSPRARWNEIARSLMSFTDGREGIEILIGRRRSVAERQDFDGRALLRTRCNVAFVVRIAVALFARQLEHADLGSTDDDVT